MTDHPGRAALAAIMEAAEKATPGPWKTHNVDDTSVINCDGASVCETCAEGGVDADVDYELNWEEREATAAFIVTARNNIASVADYVASLEAERDAAKAENERLREALDECDDYFDSRADAELFTDSPLPVENEEMRLLCVVRAALGGDNG